MEKENITLKKNYERNLQRNYLVLEGLKEYVVEEYVYRMLLDNKIQGILPVTNRLQDGKELYCYEINSMQPLERLYERKNMSYEDIRNLIVSYTEAISHLEEYLLDDQGIVLDPDCIYYHAGEKRMQFVYFPYMIRSSKESFCNLTEYILMKTNHTDEKAVKVAYQLYKMAREDNTTIDDFNELFNHGMEIECQEEIPFAPDPAEEIKHYQNISHYQEPTMQTELHGLTNEDCNVKKSEKEKQTKRNTKVSVFSIIFALVCLGALIAERVLGLFYLNEQYEMILFAATVMFAVTGIVFWIIAVKKEKFEEKEKEIKEEQKEFIFEEFHETKERPVISVKQEIRETEAYRYNQEPHQMSWSNAGETTVIGVSDSKKGSQLRQIDGLGNEQCTLNHFPFLIGRMAQCVDMVLNDSSISKMHARIEEKEGRLFLQDMNSTNGTMKNGMLLKLNESIPIDVGDEITFGRLTFRYL